MVGKLRGRSPAELYTRGRQAILARIERIQGFARARTAFVETAGITFALQRSFASLPDAAGAPEAIARASVIRDGEWEERVYGQYHELKSGRVSLLGFRHLSIGNPPRWHREALSGREAPRHHWSRIDHLDILQVGDHKVLWELNRLQYLMAPTMCWLLDHDHGALELVHRHLESWLAENPPRMGANWVSSLELAYRAIAWCWLLWLLRDAVGMDLRSRLAGSLEAHGRHIERYLSTYFSPNTHLTGEALGLFYIGTVLEGSRHAARWREKGAEILENCLGRQVLSDGVYFEQASQYHRYTTEIYLHYALLAGSTGWNVSRSVRDTLNRLFDVLRSLASGDGRMPLLGDDDGGLLLPFDHRPPDDVKALLFAGAVFLDRPELIPVGASPVLAYWLCGIEATDRLIEGGGASPAWRDISFDEGGLIILRDGWRSEDAVAVIDAGPHGALSCGHSHADALAMTLALGGSALFIDRGTLTYTGPQRDEYRSTRSHNTLEIDDESSVIPGSPFRWLNVPQRASGTVFSSGEITGFAGLALGHEGSPRPSRHERQVLHLRGGGWVVLDRGERSGASRAIVRWQLSPGLRAEKFGECAAVIWSEEGKVIATVLAPMSSALHITGRGASPRLGSEVAAEVLEIEATDSLRVLTVIVPGLVRDWTVSGGLRLRASASCAWRDDIGRHEISLSSLHEIGGLQFSAELCWYVDRTLTAMDPRASSEMIAASQVRAFRMDSSEGRVTTSPDIMGRMAVFEKVGGKWTSRRVWAPGGAHD